MSDNGQMHRLGLLAHMAVGTFVACASSRPQVVPTATAPVEIEPAAPQPAPHPEATAGAAYAGPEPCMRAVTGDSPVARVCRVGGVPSAKATMKDLVKEGRAAGIKLSCDDCHLDSADFSRIGRDAPEKLRSLLVAIGRQ
jgi:hypothetical protein